jgi:translation initiation factor 2B subunit (eIF-2B alpha/beta/delta family)
MDLTDDKKLNALLADNKSGSIDLLLQLNAWLKANLAGHDKPELLIQKIKSSLAHFQTVEVYLDNLNELLKGKSQRDLFAFFDNTEAELNGLQRRIFENGLRYFKKAGKIITISNSYSVARFLIQLYDKSNLNEVVVCESRPVMEGRLLAEKLIEEGIPVRLITDASVSQYIEVVDAAIIGADKILRDGSIINKIGSRQLAILCRYFNTPIYVVADKTKFSGSNEFEQENKPNTEIWDFKHKKLKVENFYFEKIERELITKVISNE